MLTSTSGPSGFDVGIFHKQLMDTSKESLKEIVKDKITKKIKIHTRVVMGRAPDEIVSVAKKGKADLIVISTHGETGWRHLVFGSVAEKVVRFSSCPVLTIREPDKNQ
jgi:nucleotide-binding universal stress UspA family protein